MVKNFRLVVPKQRPSFAVESAPAEELPEISLPRLGSRVKAYKPVPTKAQWHALGGQSVISQSDYTQHRQQDTGRAIAMDIDNTNKLLRRDGTIWTFSQYINHHDQDEYKLYTVDWDGQGIPPAGISSATYSQGKTYVRQYDDEEITFYGKPDKFTWAVKWLVEGIPADSQWPPIPSRWPSYPYNAIALWPEYPTVAGCATGKCG